MNKLARNRAALLAIGGAGVVITLLRLLVASGSPATTTSTLLALLGLGAVLALIQRRVSVFAERSRGAADRGARPVQVQLIQVILAFAFSFLITSAIVFGYVLMASLVLINDGLKLGGAASAEKGSAR